MIKLLYLILLAAAALFWPLYKGDVAFLLLAALIILPFLLAAQLAVTVRMFSAENENDHVTVFRNSEGEVGIKLINRSIFPLSCVKIRLRTVFMPTGEVSFHTVTVPVPARSSECVSVNVSSEHCGRTDIFVEYIRISDIMGLFSWTLYRKKLSAAVHIIPRISEKFSALAEYFLSLGGEAEGESGEKPKNGTPGDVCGFREFAPGDRLSLMHYKLSARFDKDIVKVLSVNNSSKYLLTADLSHSDLTVRDEVLCRLMSCAYYLNAGGAEVYAAVPAHSQCDGIYTENGLAAQYSDDASYFALAEALCESSFEGIPEAYGFIMCDVGKEAE